MPSIDIKPVTQKRRVKLIKPGSGQTRATNSSPVNPTTPPTVTPKMPPRITPRAPGGYDGSGINPGAGVPGQMPPMMPPGQQAPPITLPTPMMPPMNPGDGLDMGRDVGVIVADGPHDNIPSKPLPGDMPTQMSPQMANMLMRYVAAMRGRR